jgi:mRNA-degrading endonuclease YafQ of YafQ-DinJ toxin-antitoxin module
MKKQNAVLLYNVDKEDYWLYNPLVFPIPHEATKTFQESFDMIKEKLQSEEVINYIIDKSSLEDDYFDGDMSPIRLRSVKFDGVVIFEFENDEDIIEFTMSIDHTTVF